MLEIFVCFVLAVGVSGRELRNGGRQRDDADTSISTKSLGAGWKDVTSELSDEDVDRIIKESDEARESGYFKGE